MQWVIGLPVLALAMGYLSEMWQRHTVTRQRDEAVRDLAAAREQLEAAREQRIATARYRAAVAAWVDTLPQAYVARDISERYEVAAAGRAMDELNADGVKSGIGTGQPR